MQCKYATRCLILETRSAKYRMAQNIHEMSYYTLQYGISVALNGKPQHSWDNCLPILYRDASITDRYITRYI